jgi:hypothetical protein
MLELVEAASRLRAGVLAILPLGNRPKLFSRLFVFVSLTVLLVLRLPSFFLNAPLNPESPICVCASTATEKRQARGTSLRGIEVPGRFVSFRYGIFP